MVDYYSKSYISHLIRENSLDREIALLGKNNANIRALKIKCNYDIERILKLANWNKNRQNLYRSVARLQLIPNFTFNPKLRSSETGEWFQEKFDKLITTYDLFLDFDKDENSTIYDVLEEVKKLIKYFNEYKIGWYILFSGGKGFQVIIDGKYMPKPEVKEGGIYPHKLISENIKKLFNFKYLDLSNNGVPNRLCKIPYSLIGENVALPLSNEQIDNFNLEDMKVENIMKKVTLIRRGNLERFSELSESEKIGNTTNFIKEVLFK